MTIADDAATAERFLRDHLAATAPPASEAPADDDLAITLKRVEHDGERTLRAVFGLSVPFNPRDLRAPDLINGSLRALLTAHPPLRAYRIDVTAETAEA